MADEIWIEMRGGKAPGKDEPNALASTPRLAGYVNELAIPERVRSVWAVSEAGRVGRGRLNGAEMMEMLCARWFEDSTRKLIQDGGNPPDTIMEDALHWCESLAWSTFKQRDHGRVRVKNDDAKEEKFETPANVELLASVSPVKRGGSTFVFIDDAFVDFFAARKMWREIMTSLWPPADASKFGISHQSLCVADADVPILRLLGGFVNRPDGNIFKERLLDVVRLSRHEAAPS